ncbi:MAG: leucyl/phenylalanyl-tRNA--protein transferase [Spirochaetota bacterium]
MRDFRSFFGDPKKAKSDMIAVGGDFSRERLYYAYSNGIFPWSQNPIRWYCLDPRAIFDIDSLHISRTIKRKIKKQIYSITFNESFTEVMKGCALRIYEPTWITEGFVKGYTEFHYAGFAHSVEAWDEFGNLVGGVYGVAIGKFFAGESMFSFSSDAGKIALAYLFTALKNSDFILFDTQQLNEVTWNLGAYEIPKAIYLERLEKAVHPAKQWKPQVPSLEEVIHYANT